MGKKFGNGKRSKNILVQLSDKAKCYTWMHNKAYDDYYVYDIAIFGITIVDIGGCSLAVLAFSGVGKESQIGYLANIAALLMLALILEIIRFSMKFTQLTEQHRTSILHWQKLQSDIETGLVHSPEQAIETGDSKDLQFKMFIEEYQRLVSISPNIPKYIIKALNAKVDVEEEKITEKLIDLGLKEA